MYTNHSTGRLTAVGSRYYHENTPGIKDKVEILDLFGHSLATGNFDVIGNDELVVGSVGEGLLNTEGRLAGFAGAVHILYNGESLFTQWFHQNSVDMKDTVEPDDKFGYTLCD